MTPEEFIQRLWRASDMWEPCKTILSGEARRSPEGYVSTFLYRWDNEDANWAPHATYLSIDSETIGVLNTHPQEWRNLASDATMVKAALLLSEFA